MGKRQKTGFAFLLAAGFFLWNPIVGMMDLLPDFIGYLLMLAGLFAIGDLQEQIGEARIQFRTVAWIAFGEFAAQCFIRFFLSATVSADDAYGQNTAIWILLFSFVVTALECYFLIPAYRNLFLGLGRFAESKNAAHLKANRRGKTQYERMAGFSVIFVIGKNLLSLLPEFSALSTYEYHYGTDTAVTADLYVYIRGIRVVFLLPAVLLTLWWLICWIHLFFTAKKDAAFQETVQEEYAQKISSNPKLLSGRKMHLSFLLIRLGAAFLPTFLLLRGNSPEDAEVRFGMELLPDFAAVAFFFAAIFLLYRNARLRIYEICIGGMALIAGVFHWIATLLYYRTFTVADALNRTDALYHSMPVRISGTVGALLTAICFFLLLCRLWRMVVRGRDQKGLAAARKDYRSRFGWLIALSALVTAGKISDLFLRARVGWLWWIPLVLGVALVLVLSSVLADLEQDYGMG